MKWILRLLQREHSELSSEQMCRLVAWQALPPANPHLPATQARYVVVDVETSGLNVRKDKLISIGAIAVSNGRINFADSMEVVLQQPQASDRENILIHGISGTTQREGLAPADALLAFLEYLGKDPLIAFHVAFDNTMISKAIRQHLGFKFEHGWADLAHIAPALYPELTYSCRSLDQWLAHFAIRNYARHSALADACATAELMLTLRPRMLLQQINDFQSLRNAYLSHRRSTSLS